MKSLLIVITLLVATQAANLKRKSYRENFDDFNDLIMREVGEELNDLYYKYESELLEVFSYLGNRRFEHLITEMEALPEFNALIDFIEESGIEIHFFIALLHEALGFEPYEYLAKNQSNSIVHQEENILTQYLRELISLLPREQLRSLYAEKMETDEDFRATMENMHSEEYSRLWNALWSNTVFIEEVNQLRENGIELEIVIEYSLALVGLEV